MGIDLTLAFEQHTTWLHRRFVAQGVDATTADDLVQLTLIEAWRNLHKLESEDGMRPWLAAIAGFVLKRWWRSSVRETHAVLSQVPDVAAAIADDRLPEPSQRLEQDDLAALVAQAMDRIADADRVLLRARYDDERTVADLADGAGITAAHMAVRLQRVRAKVRDALVEVGGSGLAAYGFDPLTIGWKATRLWCPMGCNARLSMHIDPAAGIFALKCPCCNSEEGQYLAFWESMVNRSLLTSIRSASQALTRTAEEGLWTMPRVSQVRHCPVCDAPIDIRVRLATGGENTLDSHQLWMTCPVCGPLQNSTTFRGMAVFHPEGRAFWHVHEQIRTIPPQPVTFEQQEAVRVDLTTSASSDRLTFIFDDRGTRLLTIIPDA